MKRQSSFAVLASAGIVLTAFLWVLPRAHAQTTITNVSQFSSAFDQPGLGYPPVFPCELSMFQPMDTWFLDFTALTNAVGAVTNYSGQTQNGITVWPLRLIQAADTGEVVLKYAGTNDVELLRIAAPTDYVAFATYGETLWSWAVLSGWAILSGEFHTSYDDLIADGYTCLNPPRVVMDVWAAAAADEEAYYTNGVTVAAEDEGSGPGGMMLMGMMLMAVDPPCTITNDSDPFFITDIQPDANGNMVIQWPSCSDHLYEVQAAPALSETETMPPFLWSTLATTCGNDGTTSYTDEDSWLFDQRFYRVRRLASTPPTISCPADVTVECDQSTDPSSTGVATASNVCGTASTVTFTDDISGSCPQTITRTWEAANANGDSVTCVQTITVQDTTPPTVTVPTGSALGCNPATLPTDASVKALVTASDNCSVPTVTVTHVDSGTACAMTRTFTVTATDGCGNASAAPTVVYTWTADTTPPTVTVPTGSNLGCNPSTLPTDASVGALVTATDDCGTPTVNVSHVDANNGCAVTRTFTVTATDGCGNASAAQTVVYIWTADTTPPTITCPAAITVSSLPAPNPSSVTASDNCGGTVTKAFVNDSVVTNGCQIVVTRTYRATDACGNSATCTQTITVSPLISPTDCILWHAPLANSPANDDTDPSRINGQISGTKYKYVFKAGSTIPIQVRVNGCTAADVTTNPNVVAEVNVYADQNCDNLPDGNELLIDYNGVGEAGGVMDNVNGFKKYNLDTKTLTTPGCYILEVVVTDASTGQSCKERVLLQRR